MDLSIGISGTLTSSNWMSGVNYAIIPSPYPRRACLLAGIWWCTRNRSESTSLLAGPGWTILTSSPKCGGVSPQHTNLRRPISSLRCKLAVPMQALPVKDDARFFDRVKRAFDNGDVYNEFLKVANLFSQDYIVMSRRAGISLRKVD